MTHDSLYVNHWNNVRVITRNSVKPHVRALHSSAVDSAFIGDPTSNPGRVLPLMDTVSAKHWLKTGCLARPSSTFRLHTELDERPPAIIMIVGAAEDLNKD